jgi:hypothetical protein
MLIIGESETPTSAIELLIRPSSVSSLACRRGNALPFIVEDGRPLPYSTALSKSCWSCGLLIEPSPM